MYDKLRNSKIYKRVIAFVQVIACVVVITGCQQQITEEPVVEITDKPIIEATVKLTSVPTPTVEPTPVPTPTIEPTPLPEEKAYELFDKYQDLTAAYEIIRRHEAGDIVLSEAQYAKVLMRYDTLEPIEARGLEIFEKYVNDKIEPGSLTKDDFISLMIFIDKRCPTMREFPLYYFSKEDQELIIKGYKLNYDMKARLNPDAAKEFEDIVCSKDTPDVIIVFLMGCVNTVDNDIDGRIITQISYIEYEGKSITFAQYFEINGIQEEVTDAIARIRDTYCIEDLKVFDGQRNRSYEKV